MTGYTATYRHTISVEEGGEEGNCLHIRQGYHHVIDGYPNCVVADAVINFFMGRTDKLQQVGFNPRLARQGHLGESIKHEQYIWGLKMKLIASIGNNCTKNNSIINASMPEFFFILAGFS